MLDKGEAETTALHYAPLPPSVVDSRQGDDWPTEVGHLRGR